MRRKVLMHAREAGIATVFSSLIPVFFKNNWEVDINFNSISKKYLDIDVFNTHSACDVLLCGFDSVDIDETKDILLWARNNNILSIGILDAWKGIDRFWKSDGSLREMVDFLFVPDIIIANWLIKRGIDHNIIKIIQHPVIKRLQSIPKKRRQLIRNSVEKKYNADSKDILMFFSEPIYDGFNNERKYTSLSNAKIINQKSIPLLDWMIDKYAERYHLFMRTHPVEDVNPSDLVSNGNNLSLDEALFSPKLIIGVGSTVLRYAAALGLPVRNISDNIQWSPAQSNYDSKIWKDIVSNGLFGHNLNVQSNDRLNVQSNDRSLPVFDQIIALLNN